MRRSAPHGRHEPGWGIIGRMAVVNDLLYQLAGSSVDEADVAAELRIDLPTARRCLERLRGLGLAVGPELEKGANMWSPPDGAEFPDLVAKAKAAGVSVRESIAAFAGGG
jgi:hypothetical protein